jgi:hypothetical protein
MNPGYHAMFVGLATGTLVLAFVALAYRVWFPRPRHVVLGTVWAAADAVALYAAIVGVAALAASAASGFGLRPLEALLNSPITKNKILLAALSLVAWCSYLAIRLKAGPKLWERPFAGHYALVMALMGFLFLISTNSIGGDIAGIPSGYERIAQTLGFRTRHAFYFPTWINVLVLLLGLAALAAGIAARRRRPSAPPA